MALSVDVRQGTNKFTYHTLEGTPACPRAPLSDIRSTPPPRPSLSRAGNWQEERCRLEVGEWLDKGLMEGAECRALEADVSIAPPTRDPYLPSTGQLVIPSRTRRSKLTNDSSRQGADDGYRTFAPPEQLDFVAAAAYDVGSPTT